MGMPDFDGFLLGGLLIAIVSFVLGVLTQKAKKLSVIIVVAIMIVVVVAALSIFAAYHYGWESSILHINPSPITSSQPPESEEEGSILKSETIPETESIQEESADTAEQAVTDDRAIAEILKEAEKLAKAEDYEGAVKKIQAGLTEYGESAELSDKLDEYAAALLEQRNEKMKAYAIAAILEETEMMAKAGDYEGAVNRIQSGLIEYGESDELSAKLTVYEASLQEQRSQKKKADAIATIIDEAAALAEAGDYEGAIARIQTGLAEYRNEDILQAKYDEYAAVLENKRNEKIVAVSVVEEPIETVSLSTLKPINGGFKWNEGAPADPFGSDYSEVCNYHIYHGNYCSGSYTEYAEYRLSGQYDTLSFQISPYKDFGENADSDVQVYADKELIYTSPLIRRKSGSCKITLDIYNAEYLKIVINKGEYGCIMLSDVTVGKTPNYRNTKNENVVSLATFSPINGGFSWDGYYPSDPYGNDYTLSRNYVIYHGNYCSSSYTKYAEYRLSGKYTEFSLTIAPKSDFGTNAQSYVQIYVDNVIKYTSPLITEKGGIYNAKVDVTGADYLKIVINKGEYGCVLLSDLLLKKASNPKVTSDNGTAYLSTLSPLNGGFDWGNRFPANIKGDSYLLSRNYSIFHGNYCSGSYTKSGEYYINGEYSTFSMDYAPYSDFGQNASTSLKSMLSMMMIVR